MPARAADIARDLIRFDTTNFGSGKAHGERPAVDYIDAFLQQRGVETTIVTPPTPDGGIERPSLIARLPGRDRSLPACVLHGHTDVVPAIAGEWSVPPFAGVVKDGCLWGRGAVDMKNMLGMMLACVDRFTAAGERPRRDTVLAFFADEEAGGGLGAHYVVEHHPELLAGVTTAVSEIGGYSIEVAGRRAYLVEAGEKGYAWVRITMHGRGGHGSARNRDNAVSKIASIVARIAEREWPVRLTPTTSALVEGLRTLSGLPSTATPDEVVAQAGVAASFLAATLRSTANPTMLQAGTLHNVIPATASAVVDLRPLPGDQEAVLREITAIAGADAEIEIIHQGRGYEADPDGDIVAAMRASLQHADPGAPVLPYLLNAGTDAKALGRLGIAGYGFVPSLLPPGFDYPGSYHAADERIPLSSLAFGERVLADFLDRY